MCVPAEIKNYRVRPLATVTAYNIPGGNRYDCSWLVPFQQLRKLFDGVKYNNNVISCNYKGSSNVMT